jgi:hypothetical protein
MDQEDAARMATRKKHAIELVEKRASELRVALAEVVWDTRSRDDRWSFRVAWQGGFRVIPIDEDLLIDEDTGAAFEGLIRSWFDEQVALLCPELDDDADLGQRRKEVDR